MRGKTVSAIVLAIVMLTTVPVGTSADVEDNGSFETAENVPIPGIVTGSVNHTDKDDIYRFQALKGQTMWIKVKPNATLGVNLYLYRMDGSGASAVYNEVAADRAPTIGVSEGVARKVNYTINSMRDEYWMYAWVGAYTGYGTYELDIRISSQDDAGTDTDAGDTFEKATNLTAGDYSGYLANADDEDIYKIMLVKGDSIYVDIYPETSVSINLHLMRLVDNDGLPEYQEVAKHKRTGDEGRGQHRHVEYSLNSDEATTWMYMRLYRDQDMGNYSLLIHVDHQDDAGSGTDAPDSKVGATEITGTGNYQGFLKGLDTLDFYTTTLSDREVLEINVTPEATATVSLTLFIDGNQVSQDKAKHPDIELGKVRGVNYTMPRTHDDSVAILQVLLDAGKGNYTMVLTITPKPVDDDPPEVVLLEPEPDSLVKNKRETEFKGTATDFNEITRVELSMDQVTWTNATIVGDYGQYEWNATLSFPRSGNNTIYVRSTDDQGNEGTTMFYVRFKRDRPSPGFEVMAMLMALAVGMVIMGRRTRR